MRSKRKKTVFVAMSGGVDSSVTAALLLREGFTVVGIHMKCWSRELTQECTETEDEHAARMAAAHLNIPFYVWNFVEEYKTRVVAYMLQGYEQGITPNPDMMCNKEIKFGLFYEKAMKLGADYVATGHYARIQREIRGEIQEIKLLEGKDEEKDQSYFLAFIKKETLNHVLFPVGEYTKLQVRQLAKKFDLPNANRKDSQGICFVGKVRVSDFLKEYIESKQGNIVDLQGNKLGTHPGVFYYTIGQRQGLNLPDGPYFIVRKNIEKNELIVSKDEKDLFVTELHMADINFISNIPPGTISTKIRYRQKAVPASIEGNASSGFYKITFEDPQRAVASGQFAALYKGNQLLGGGVIR